MDQVQIQIRPMENLHEPEVHKVIVQKETRSERERGPSEFKYFLGCFDVVQNVVDKNRFKEQENINYSMMY